jgi:hypothetical protein
VATATIDRLQSLTGADARDPDAPDAPRTIADREAEMRVARLVHDLFFEAREARRGLTAEWKRNYRILNGKVWSPNAGESWAPRPDVPKIWPIIASLASWMTDQRPTLEAVASTPPFSPYADYFGGIAQDMTALLQTSYNLNSLPTEISMMLWDVLTYGVGYVKNVWEPWLADGKGDALFRRVDPFCIFPDPHARTPDQLSHIIQAHTMTVDDMDRAFPGSRAKLAGETPSLLDRDMQAPHKLDDAVSSTAPRYNLAPLGSNSQRVMAPTKGGPAANQRSEMVTVLECWVRSHEHKSDTRTKETWTCIVVAGSVVLKHEDAWDVNSFGSHPFDKMALFSTGEWYGPALVSLMASAQVSINRILAAIETNVDLVGNPMLVEAPRSASRNKRITNRPGSRLEANPNDIAWLQPPQMHPQMAVMLLQYYAGELEYISGVKAIMSIPGGRNAQGVVDSVQDAAFVRVRATLRELEQTLRRAGSKMMATIAEFYDEPRLAVILGDGGERTALTIRKHHFYDPTNNQPLRFALMADAGSEMATSRQALENKAISLYGLQAIDRLELLKAIKWSNYTNVAQRVDAAAMTGSLGGAQSRAPR